jgi:intracellular sulfur oxidation DsrE/DsrF family protein
VTLGGGGAPQGASFQTQGLSAKPLIWSRDAGTGASVGKMMGIAQATKGLRNIRNHLDVDPKAKIVAVAHAEGVDFLMEGAKTGNNQEFAALVSDLSARGVVFEICEITLKNRNLKKEQFILGPGFTPSGVVRIANLQAREQYAYIKP